MFSLKKFFSRLLKKFAPEKSLAVKVVKPEIKPPEVLPVEKTCLVCGKSFKPIKSHQVFCSADCRDKFHNEKKKVDHPEKTCPVCGKSFTPVRKTQVFCSTDCWFKFYREKKKADPLEKTCPICGKSFKPKKFNQIFCSEKCAKKAYDRRAAEREGEEKIELTCDFCHSPFTPDHSRRKYCSEFCRKKAGAKKSFAKKIEIHCPECGKIFQTSADAADAFCSDKCRQKSGVKKNSAPKKSLDDWMKEAAACHMSYGQYRAAVEFLGKTFEELVVRE